MQPERKITAAGIAGFLTTILVWAANQWAHVEIPGEVAAAVTGLITVITGYLVPNSDVAPDA